MDLSFSKEDEAFRAEVRAFLEAECPSDLRGARIYDVGREGTLRWTQILYKKGWVAPSWPKEYGGTGWSPTQKYIWDEETARIGTPALNGFGLNMVGPVIYTFGTDEQKKRYLPGILSGANWWCQGYSEPGAGSDLAGVRTRAVREGDHYIVNGQKTWTTLAQYADMIFCLVRTDPNVKKQEGISFLLIDMKTPGIAVRPIITLDGGHEVNDVFLENVKVPVENRIGEENKGWTYAKFLLGHERSNIAGVARSKKSLEKLKSIARSEMAGGRPLIESPDFKRKVAELEIDLLALEFTDLRALSEAAKGKPPGPETSPLKIRGTEIQQRLTELTMEAVGYYANPFIKGGPGRNEPEIGPDYAIHSAPTYFNTRKTSIYGGTNEIQRNIIAKMVLGL
ncbi:MAG: acyl-CoA dehydrogenase family protein [Alphaproteobacteria bacterium]|nr:acyl-CoA dehydrogenase family protein [Alphaproteobacteria bacterium]